MVEINKCINDIKKIDSSLIILEKPINSSGNYIIFDKVSFANAQTYYHFKIFFAKTSFFVGSVLDEYSSFVSNIANQKINNLFEIENIRSLRHDKESTLIISQIDIKVSNYWSINE
jgi:hypothetical protein